MEIKRDVYLEQFKIRKDNGMIKIITGKCVNIGRHRTKGEDEAAEYNYCLRKDNNPQRAEMVLILATPISMRRLLKPRSII